MDAPRPPHDATADYLCVDGFLRTAADARSIKTAFELGLIDRLRGGTDVELDALRSALGLDPPAFNLLVEMLRTNRVVEPSGRTIRLRDAFRHALAYEDLLSAKIQFAERVAPDFLNLFTVLLRDPQRFMREARLFKLFDYRLALDPTPQNLERTREWVRFTTALTRYEAGVCLGHYDVSPHRRLLDIGGNSGEFALRACRRHPRLEATVLDLPGVCRVGREHLAGEPEAARIRFVEGNALAGPLPAGADLVSFKSMLHDWPDDPARRLLANATQALAPGGTVLIFERSRIELGPAGMPWSLVPMLLFFRSFRPESFYPDYLRSLGYQDVQTRQIRLETPFILVTALKPE